MLIVLFNINCSIKNLHINMKINMIGSTITK